MGARSKVTEENRASQLFTQLVLGSTYYVQMMYMNRQMFYSYCTP